MRKRRVLVVDGEPDAADRTAAHLRRGGGSLDVLAETTVAAALARLDDADIDCIVSDYDLPDGDGLDVLAAVRDARPEFPFVLFTGDGSEELASEAISAGVTDYVTRERDADWDILANRVRAAVDHARARARAAALGRVNEVIRDVQRGLVEAETRDEIEATVCDRLARAEPYVFAWVGERDPDTDEIRPRARAGVGEAYLDAVTVRADDSPLGRGPGGRAVRTGEAQVARSFDADDSMAAWRDAAAAHGFRSVMALPLALARETDGAADSVLCVYADREDAFDGREGAVLRELAETVAVAVDAAETRRQLTERKRELDFFERIVEGVGVGVAAYHADGRLAYVNDAFASLLAADRDSVADLTLSDLNPAFDRDDVADYWAGVETGESRRAEVQLRRADGSWLPVETVTTPVERHGERFYVGTATDITERTQRRADLEQSERLFNAVFDDPTSFVGLLEVDGTLIRANQMALSFVGETQAAVAGRKFWETPWWEPYSAERLQADIDRAADGDPVRFEAENTGVGGETVTLDVSLRPVHDEAGGVCCLIAEGHDVTERKRQERKLERQNERLEEFASIVSHDLRNPLTVAKGNVELAAQDGEVHYLDAAAAALGRMDRLIDGVLQFARHGRVVNDPTPVRLAAVVSVARATIGSDRLTVTTTGDLGTLSADRERLRTLFENLFRNAVEHGEGSASGDDGDGGERSDSPVTVTVGPLDGEGFYVEDDGPGIPAADRETVFEQGYSTASDGTGFGLPIVQTIAEAHGWTVEITESETGGVRVECRTG